MVVVGSMVVVRRGEERSVVGELLFGLVMVLPAENDGFGS